jgi:hypothetical protein
MKKIFFTNVNYAGNAGDFWSSPTHYYNFPNREVKQIHFMDFVPALENNPNYESNKLKDQIVVIGGGGLITDRGYYLQNIIEWLVENNKVIFWGIGSNAFKKPCYDIFDHKNVLLVGTRDVSHELRHRYVPCVSCKMNLFERKYDIDAEIGIIEHPSHFVNIPNIPKTYNTVDIIELIKFIGSKNIIISSTYHGVYWAQILGKKVLYYNDTGLVNTKFSHLKNRVTQCNNLNYLDKITNLTNLVGFKEECRHLNDIFYKDVLQVI